MDTEIIINKKTIKEITEKIRQYTLAAVTKDRYEHCLRTADFAVKLCRKYGVDEDAGYLAGLGHDMCKCMSDVLLISLALHDGYPITEIEKEKPSLLHGRAAAVKLKEDFLVNDTDILQAVACHTFGDSSLGNLGKIIYVSDKIEPGRSYITDDYYKKIAPMSLDKLTSFVITDCLNIQKKKKNKVSSATKAFLKSLN